MSSLSELPAQTLRKGSEASAGFNAGARYHLLPVSNRQTIGGITMNGKCPGIFGTSLREFLTIEDCRQ
jgi:hypothetical protein